MNGLTVLYAGSVIAMAVSGYLIGSRFGSMAAGCGGLLGGVGGYVTLVALSRLNARDTFGQFVRCEECGKIQAYVDGDASEVVYRCDCGKKWTISGRTLQVESSDGTKREIAERSWAGNWRRSTDSDD